MNDHTQLNADHLVIFGFTGDLAKKMTYRALYRLEKSHKLTCRIIGVAVDRFSEEDLKSHISQALREDNEDFDPSTFHSLIAKISYISGDFSEQSTYVALNKALEGASKTIFYLEIPPKFFSLVASNLASHSLLKNSHVMFEKPFGHDYTSATTLNKELHEFLPEDQILRIDHFLGKQPVQDIIYLRFGNTLFESVWNRNYVESIQITMAEAFGVDDRGSFYDPVGASRDVLQNHLLQVLALLTMEAPVSSTYAALWDKKSDVFQSMPSVDPRHIVTGQYFGYQNVYGVKPGSNTETYVAAKFSIDNWRWSGVPIFIRAGKALRTTATEVRVILRGSPNLPFLGRSHPPRPNQIILRIDPDPAMRIHISSKGPEGLRLRDAHLDLEFAKEIGVPPEPYELLIHSALSGDYTLFSREDAVEETWRIIDPLLNLESKPFVYQVGSWGPEEADNLLHGFQNWQEPWI